MLSLRRSARTIIGLSAIVGLAFPSAVFVIAATGAARAGSSDAYANAVLASVPFAYYRLAETSGSVAVDDAGNALDGTIGSGVRLGTPSLLPCCTSTSATLTGNGAPTVATIGVPANAKFQVSGALTMEAVIAESSAPQANSVLVGYGSDVVFAPYMLYVDQAGRLAAQLRLSGGKFAVSAPTPIAIGKTTHVAATYDGSMLRLYANGALVASRSASGVVTGYDASHGLAIGDDGAYTSPPFHGALQHVALYARALAASEISAHHAVGEGTNPNPVQTATPVPTATPTSPKPTSTPTAQPIPGKDAYGAAVSASRPFAYYRLGETSGSVAADGSGNGHPGSIGSNVALGVPGIVPCCTGTAMRFSGSHGQPANVVSVPPNAIFDAGSALTMEGVVAFTAAPVPFSVLFGYGTDSVYAPYMIYLTGANRLAAQFGLTGGKVSLAAPAAVISGETYHVAATYDGATARLYVDGAQVASEATSGTFTRFDATHGFAIGDDGGLADPLFDGTLQHVALYARALSAAEIGAHAGASGIGGVPVPTPTPTIAPTSPPVGGPALVDPPTLASAHGALTFDVTASADASGRPRFVYAGGTTPPTLRLLPGDTLYVNFTNALPRPPAGAGYTNDTSLHYHGLTVSPQAPADDSIDLLASPGQTLHYVVPIPSNQAPGLFWYHTHAHGEAERQTLSGMSGALVIDGIAASLPQITKLKERVLVIRDAPAAGFALPAADRAQVRAMRWAMRRGVGMGSASRMTTVGASRSSSMPIRTRMDLVGGDNASASNPFVTRVPRFRTAARPSVADQHCLANSVEPSTMSLTVDGQTQPSIAIGSGETQFWRVVNAGADTYLDLSVDNAALTVLAIDGVPIARGVNTPSSLVVDHYVLPPSSRVEFTITGPAANTRSFLRTACFDSGPTGLPMPARILASLDPSPPTASSTTSIDAFRRTATAPNPRRGTSPSSPSDAASLAIGTSERRLRVSTRRATSATGTGAMPGMSMSAPATSADASMRYSRRLSAAAIMSVPVALSRTVSYTDQYTIDGVAYDPSAPPAYYAQAGTAQDWTIVNTQTEVHTFHIHQIHFVLEAIDGVAQARQYVMDNVNVSPGGSVRVRLDFSNPTIVGTFLFHCHILSHEDRGMMAKIRVGTAPPLATSSSSLTFASSGAAPQTVKVSGGRAPYGLAGCAGFVAASVAGNAVSIVPKAAGSCLLTIADASSPSLLASVAIYVAPSAPKMSVAPSALSFAAPGASPANATIVGGTAPFSIAGCAGTAAETIVARTVSVSPQATGACSFVVTDATGLTSSLAVSVNGVAASASADNLTFHQNNLREGWYASETTLTTSNVNAAHFGLLGTLGASSGMPALSKVFAQPLFASAERTPSGTHDLVIVASSSAQVYAYDGGTMRAVWHRSFTGGSVVAQPWTDSLCADINPEYGIVGTPVIDRKLDRVYVVVATDEGGTAAMRIHALSLADGTDAVPPTELAQTVPRIGGGSISVSPQWNMNRGALLEANGNIYVPLGTHCDDKAASTHGWLLSYDATTLRFTGSVTATDGVIANSIYLGSPWMSGFGPAADAQGNIFFATGNGATDDRNNFAMSVVKVPGNLSLGAGSTFTPATATADSDFDADLGSGGVMLFPDQPGPHPRQLIQGGKCAHQAAGTPLYCYKYVLDRDALGGQRNGDAGALGRQNVAGMMFGGPAYFRDANNAQRVIYGGSPLDDYLVTPNAQGALTLQQAASSNVGCLVCRDSGGSQPIVSSNGTRAGSAIVWVIKGNPPTGGAMSLYAFDAVKMGAPLFSGRAGSWNVSSGASYIGAALVSPTVANGRVYVPVDGGVAVFGAK